jgi:hypothetical protein
MLPLLDWLRFRGAGFVFFVLEKDFSDFSTRGDGSMMVTEGGERVIWRLPGPAPLLKGS